MGGGRKLGGREGQRKRELGENQKNDGLVRGRTSGGLRELE